MSVIEGLGKWLTDSGKATVNLDSLPKTPEAAALYNLPNDEVTRYLDGSEDVVAYYQFLIRKPSQQKKARAASQDWFEAFADWVREQNLLRALPDFGAKKTCHSVELAGAFTVSGEDETATETIFQTTFKVNFHRERS